ncbi:type II toxin-antitoxin system Phd/YefM family antitoxin [Weissella confusa]|uniref:type II toxin-antitoxin system Phd/YefM family antitoxin n=1 Tax=Weissella confusa TaxID=1583 RepID=UPI0021A2A878|nr:type II toxin-antitoxin system Phd/YefM family antitoxin [Weissella confusa]
MNLNKLTPISELKKSPMSIIAKAHELKEPVIILNNNVPVGGVIDIDTLNHFTELEEAYATKQDELNEAHYLVESLTRILNDKGERYTNEQVLKEYTSLSLEDVEDEWE